MSPPHRSLAKAVQEAVQKSYVEVGNAVVTTNQAVAQVDGSAIFAGTQIKHDGSCFYNKTTTA
ncbi:hypothetical protein C5167_035047 [Papaver somniferum]|uniref:Uncharacterized protein n=1 Tax=Papaver somniferum TaxID=3469 RepID=A0A4Y7KEJ1_PAPSO|nr:hypothetical protein C5167_035047 [Papaver somniferum]